MRYLILTLALIFSTPTLAETSHVSWYECCNDRTASGAKFDPDGLFLAHRSLPFGTRVEFKHKGKTLILVVNDRGPFVKGRDYDISRGAAKILKCKGVCVMETKVLR